MAATIALQAWATHAVQLRVARAFIEACEQDGIAVLPVKGIVTARLFYASTDERPLSDVDFRIRPSDYPKLGALARARNWQVLEDKRAYQNYVLRIGDDDVEVDVESHIGPRHVCGLEVAAMLERATRSKLLGFEASIPDLTDHAVVLIVNVFKDKLVEANSTALSDLERLPRHADFDPRSLVRRLIESRVATLGFVVADWMAQRGSEEWRPIADELEPHVGRRLYRRSLAWTRAHPIRLPQIVLARVASDDATERVLALGTMLRWRAEVALGISSRGPA